MTATKKLKQKKEKTQGEISVKFWNFCEIMKFRQNSETNFLQRLLSGWCWLLHVNSAETMAHWSTDSLTKWFLEKKEHLKIWQYLAAMNDQTITLEWEIYQGNPLLLWIMRQCDPAVTSHLTHSVIVNCDVENCEMLNYATHANTDRTNTARANTNIANTID